MAILKNRPLFSACLFYIICAFCAYFTIPRVKIVLIFVSLAVLLFCAACLLIKKLPRKLMLSAAVLSLGALLAFGGSWLAFDASMQKYERIAKQESCTVRATVMERTPSESMTVFRVLVYDVDGKAQYFDASLVCAFTSYLQVGDSFKASVKPQTLRDSASPYFSESHALADGLRMQFTCEGEAQIAQVYDAPGIALPYVSLHRLNDALCRALIDVCGKESGGLVCALLLGNRSYLDGTLSRDFERAGASHMLALSGMHVSILMGAAGFALSKLRMHRKARAVLLAFAAVGYLVLTGMSVSATRAVVMVCLLQLSYLLAADNDTLTTLGLVGTGILLLDPYSVCDGGFILSFLATFGIVVFVPPMHEYLKARTEAIAKPPHQKAKQRVLGIATAVLEALLIGVIACFAVFVPSCFLIGHLSLFSPLTTLLISPVVAALLVLGTVTLVLSPIPPLANFFATLIRLLYALCTPYLERVSGIDGALLPLTHTTVQVLGIVLCVAAFILLILPLRRKWLLSLPPALLVISLCIFFPVSAALSPRTLQAAYTHPSSISEGLVCADGYRAYVCDLSSGTGTAMQAAMYAAKNLHATEIGAILLTDCRTQHASMLSDLFTDYKTDRVYLPRTADAEMLDAQARICEVARLHGVEIVFYEYGEAVAWCDGTSVTVHRADLARSTQPVLVITLQKGDAQICLLNVTAEHTALADQAARALSGADAVVCTERGPKPRLTFSLEGIRDGEVIFASRSLASYCNPDSLAGVHKMTVDPEIAYFSIATKQEK
ncbi:MAG: ComEC/Rec2 family competence protein [Clostridia bacterium]|nr:ComEC/Rec2 family competence protein [Clostridia bacterium]